MNVLLALCIIVTSTAALAAVGTWLITHDLGRVRRRTVAERAAIRQELQRPVMTLRARRP